MHQKMQNNPWVAPFLLGLFTLLFTLPLWSHLSSFGLGDWDQFTFWNLVPYKTLWEYHQFPLWNPYGGGGRPLFANPQNGLLRPTYFVILLFGVVAGLKIELALMTGLGTRAMYFLLGHFKLHPWARLLGTSIFCFSSFFSLHFAEGHVHFAGYYLLPLFFLFYLKSLKPRSPNFVLYLILGALSLVWILFAGGIGHLLIPLGLFMGVYGLLISIQKKSFRPIRNLLVIFLLTALFGAIKLVPTYDYMKNISRLTSAKEYVPPLGLYHIYLNRDQTLSRTRVRFSPQFQYFHEYGAYMGILPLVLFFCGMFFFYKGHYPLILSGLFCFFLSLGNFFPLSPWRILHLFPPFSSTQVPFRYVVFFVFSLALVVSFFAHHLLQKFRKNKAVYGVLCGLILLIIADLLWVNTRVLAQAFPGKFEGTSVQSAFVQIQDRDKNRSGAYSSMCLNCLQNRGTINDYDPVPQKRFARALGERGYRGEVYLLSGEKAHYTYWSPNKLVIRFHSSRPTRLVINQTYRRGWKVAGRGKVVAYQGLLSIVVPAGQGEITLVYRPVAFFIGLWISVISLVLAIGFLLWKKKSPSKSS